MTPSHPRRRLLGATALASVGGLLPTVASAQSAAPWPNRPIRLILGYATGGATDGVARPLEPHLQAALKQPVVFDYRPGAGATVAAAQTARAAPDGYTVHITDSGPMTILPNGKNVGYDPLTAFTSIGMVCEGCSVIVVHPSVPAKNLQELLALARAKPGTISYGTSGIGGSAHLSGELLQSMTGVRLIHIPYKGGGPAAVDLIGGQIPMAFASTGTALPNIANGRMRAIAVTSARRISVLPDVPTVAEQGVAGSDATVWFGMVAPPALPAEIGRPLHAALQVGLRDAGVQDALRKQGYEPLPGTPESFARRVEVDLAKWGKLIREQSITFE